MAENIYDPVDTSSNMQDIAKDTLEFWNKYNIPAKNINSDRGTKDFYFLEGPPTANGRPHVGHLSTFVIKDAVVRYKYMNNFRIRRRTGGWDCHGLPVELEAEKHFGFKTKKEIEDFGIGAFNQYCRESVFKYIEEWKEVNALFGKWFDLDRAYVTLRDDYIESEWWALSQLFKTGMLYKSYKIVPYCPRCETSLSSHEVSQGYEEIEEPAVFVKFRETGKTNRYFLAWTTTPWTLPSNQFLVVNSDIDYDLVEFKGEEYYVAAALVKNIFRGEFKVLASFRGNELVGKTYERPIEFLKVPEGSLVVVSGSFVTTEDGTGIVHASPAFGADDFEIAKERETKILNPVNASGKYNSEELPWNNLFIKDADPKIVEYLRLTGKLFRVQKHRHTYPFCYRCGTPMLYYPLDAWYIRMSGVRDQLVENNRKVNWVPDFLKEGRFGNFLTEAKDWALSRNRYWGTPLPVWRCENNHYESIGSRAELKSKGCTVPSDLHRPFVDEVVFSCPKCGKDMHREPYVIDTWFDSGSATYAAMHYPFERSFSPDTSLPVDFVGEAVDQTRGWFYTLLAISTVLFGKNAYRNAVSIDFILDKYGKKMSKSKGNSVYAIDLLKQFGPDPVRLFFLTGTQWKPKNLDEKVITDTSRKVLGTLLNVYSFFASNANLDSYRYSGQVIPGNALDRWILSRLNTTVSAVSERMDGYFLNDSLKLISDFIEDLSNSYLRLSRRRFWTEGSPEDKKSAYSVLWKTLDTTVKLLAPIAPFFSDFIYRRLSLGNESVHDQFFPIAETSLMNPELENEFSVAFVILESVRRLRQESNIKGRQPVTEILVSAREKVSKEIIGIISQELNAREVRFIDPLQRPLRHKATVVFSKAAPVLRDRVGELKQLVQSLDNEELYRAVNAGGQIEKNGLVISGDFLEFSEIPSDPYSYATDATKGIDVFLNRNIDNELAIEGSARELIRRIQVMRKEMRLEYSDRIMTKIDADGKFREAVVKLKQSIMNETLSDDISLTKLSTGTLWDIDGESVRIMVRRI
ncbi:MAG: isoleucine--tRNA ligase [Thermoplasmataceae archaeon]